MDLTREYEQYHDECFTTGKQYTSDHPHIGKAKLALGAIYTIERVHQEIKEKHGDERHWYQRLQISRGINCILSVHQLTAKHFYDSAYRNVRTLIEILLITNYMNRNRIETAVKFLRQEREIQSSNIELGSIEWTKKELYSEDELHDMLSAEKNRLEDHEGDLMELYHFFSNRNVHPIRTDSVENDRQFSKHDDKQLLNWQLDLILGLMTQMVKTYSDTSDFRYILNKLSPVEEKIYNDHTTPKFLSYFEENSF